MGLLLGTLIILWSGLTAGFGLYLQSRCAAYLDRGSASFFALSQITYPNAAVVFDAAIAIKCFGVGVSYLIIIGDLMPGVVLGFVHEHAVASFLLDRRFWVTVFMLIVIPLSFLRRLDSLKYTSVIALMSIGYLVILVVYHFAVEDTVPTDTAGHRLYQTPLRILQWKSVVATLSSFPVIVFAYTCHQNMFSILNEIADNRPSRTTGVIAFSIGSAASIYVLVAITGYLSFGNEIGGNIVAQYIPSVSTTIGRAAIVVLVMFSYPLQVHPCRASVDAVLKWRPRGKLVSHVRSVLDRHAFAAHDTSPPRHEPLLASTRPVVKARDSEIGDVRFAAITTVIIVLSYIVAMTVSSLEAVLAYVGSTGSTSISFILPGLFYYKISSPDSPLHQRLLKEEDDFVVDSEDGSDDDDDNDNGSVNLSTGVRRRSSAGTHSTTGGGGNSSDHEHEGFLSRRHTFFKHLFGRNLILNLRRNRAWKRRLLRRLALALAIYGVIVMITCLVTHSIFIADPH